MLKGRNSFPNDMKTLGLGLVLAAIAVSVSATPTNQIAISSIVISCVANVCTTFIDGAITEGPPQCDADGRWSGDAQRGPTGSNYAEVVMSCGGERVTGCFAANSCIALPVRSRSGTADCYIAPGNAGTCEWHP